MYKIGFIGLGIMGKPMCKNLLKAGYQLVVYDLSKIAVEELVAAGASEGVSPREVASQTEVIVTMLPNSPEVREVLLGPGGVIEGVRPGSLVIDMSSIDPLASRELGAVLAEKGVRMLDAPVSGGEPKAIDGTLSIMVGGIQHDFDTCYNILRIMGTSVVRVGDLGAGNVAKLANQIMVALNIAAMSEALVFATKVGVDPELVYQAIRGGLAGSNALDAKAPLVLEGKFNPGFRIKLHIKDLANALASAHVIGVPLPLTAGVMEILQALQVDGLGDADHGAIVRFYEKLAKVEVRRK
ncbi:2-hydroxy-3-oxopropionate reductase [Peptococcaceae bacterium CEB3]|nr:2-hydroxy-3-oxopropionate reductase [Peptococcaceae bacterium CEB3]